MSGGKAASDADRLSVEASSRIATSPVFASGARFEVTLCASFDVC
jgi:hypothetical protein